jgi:tetratricopeptide (TPR) repeat protein
VESDKPDTIPASRIDDLRARVAEESDYFGEGAIEKEAKPPELLASGSIEALSAEDSYKLGRKYQNEKLWADAIGVYERIVKDYPDFADIADVYMAIGDCYLSMGKIDDALRNFEIVRENFPVKREVAIERIEAARSARETSEESPPPSPEE